jgi:hypothetical protein
MTDHLRNLGNKFQVPLPRDENSYLGRECPNSGCQKYFKIKPGTGLTGTDLPCHCPYCGHTGPMHDFGTQNQIDYATSVVTRKVQEAVVRDLEDMARDFNRHSFNDIFSIKMGIEASPQPLRHYIEQELETDVQCASCTLQYSIYGVFAFCPDCGVHNSIQILEKNLELSAKELDLASQTDNADLEEHLIGDALENVVSAFDGFGRQVMSLAGAGSAAKPDEFSFQNISAADAKVASRFGSALSAPLDADSWNLVVRCFQKRHLLSHKLGVIDEKYVATANDPTACVGRKVRIDSQEVRELIKVIDVLGRHLMSLI